MAELTLNAQLREVTGSKVKQLRRQGLIPVVIYGQDREPVNAQVNEVALERVLQAGGTSQLVEVELEGAGRRNILVREVQRHPVRRNLLHADFYAVSMREKQQLSVPIIAVDSGARPADLVLVQALDQVEIEALPADIPAHVEVDVSHLDSPEVEPITVADLPKLPGVEYLTPADEVVFSLVASRAAAAEEEEEMEEEMGAEPEVIGRAREDEDEE
ncbi:MAG: 50S ribosomal protein L25 [Caldilineae bacterium]|nr:MAG: 50S ribosomal protein L25 [Caldilineae bacterium]